MAFRAKNPVFSSADVLIGACKAAKEFYDLMTLVVIKLGNKVYNGNKDDEDYGILRFLNTMMYPQGHDFLDKMWEYIDFS